MRRRAFAVVPFLSVVLLAGAAAASWQRPVEASVVDDWRPPEHRYGAGNRGVDFQPLPDTDVAAVEAGVVTFAGRVGGVAYVVVDHQNGLRTTYGNLATVEVTNGQAVARGSIIGVAGPTLHFGVRSGDEYIDPNQFYGQVVLIPEKDLTGT